MPMKSDFISLNPQSALPELFSKQAEPAWTQHWRDFYRLDFNRSNIEQRLGRLQVLNYQLAVQYFKPARPIGTLIVLHGYYDHMGLYGHLFRWALDNDFAVLSCDLPGHGLSTGARASISEFSEYQAVLAALFEVAQQLSLPAPWHLAGQSMGGAIALDYALNQQPLSEIGRLILFAPLVRPRAWRQSKLLYQGLRPFVKQVPRQRTSNSTDKEFVEFLQRDPLQANVLPTAWVGALSRWIPQIEKAQAKKISPIIIQGDGDRTVDWQHNLNVLEDKFKQPELCILPGAGHHLVNEQAHYRQQEFSFIERFL